MVIKNVNTSNYEKWYHMTFIIWNFLSEESGGKKLLEGGKKLFKVDQDIAKSIFSINFKTCDEILIENKKHFHSFHIIPNIHTYIKCWPRMNIRMISSPYEFLLKKYFEFDFLWTGWWLRSNVGWLESLQSNYERSAMPHYWYGCIDISTVKPRRYLLGV